MIQLTPTQYLHLRELHQAGLIGKDGSYVGGGDFGVVLGVAETFAAQSDARKDRIRRTRAANGTDAASRAASAASDASAPTA